MGRTGNHTSNKTALRPNETGDLGVGTAGEATAQEKLHEVQGGRTDSLVWARLMQDTDAVRVLSSVFGRMCK